MIVCNRGWFPPPMEHPPPGSYSISEHEVPPRTLPENNTSLWCLPSQGQPNVQNNVAQGKPKSPPYSLRKSSKRRGGNDNGEPDTHKEHTADVLRLVGWPSGLHDLEAMKDANHVTRAEMMEYMERLLKRMEGMQHYQAAPPLTSLRL